MFVPCCKQCNVEALLPVCQLVLSQTDVMRQSIARFSLGFGPVVSCLIKVELRSECWLTPATGICAGLFITRFSMLGKCLLATFRAISAGESAGR